MKFGDRERKGVIILFALIYLYAFFQYNIKNSIPAIQVNNQKIAEISVKVAELENNLKQLPERKRELERYKTANQRYSDYIAQNADNLETMEFVEKVKRLFNGKIGGVNFIPPRLSKASNPPYYEFSTTFLADMTLSELVNFMNFIESGTKKIKITNFAITPKALEGNNQPAAANAKPVQPQISDNVALSVSLVMTMYSMEKDSVEKMYEISKNKFEKFIGVDGIVIMPFAPGGGAGPRSGDFPGGGDRVVINLNDNGNGGTGVKKPLPRLAARTDIYLIINSFLFGGPNFSIEGMNVGRSENMYLKTKLKQYVEIKMNNDTYSIVAMAPGARSRTVQGSFPKHDIVLRCSTAITNIPDNVDLGADVKIYNDSDYYISVMKEGIGSDKVRIFDRNGNAVNFSSSSEKILSM